MGDDQKEPKESQAVIPVRANWSIQGIACRQGNPNSTINDQKELKESHTEMKKEQV